MAHLRRALNIGADHESGRVAQHDDRQVEGIAQLHKARGLVRRVGIDRPAQMVGIAGDHPHGSPLYPRQRRDRAKTEPGAQFQHRTGIGQKPDNIARLIAAHPVLGHDMAQQPLVSRLPRCQRPLEIGKIALGRGNRLGLVLDKDVDHTIGELDLRRPDLGWMELAQPPALDHRRPAHADAR